MDRDNVRVNTTSVISLETLGIITGTVLCILQGCGVIDIGWFWATFPFWIPLALDAAVVLIAIFVCFIIVLVDEKR